MTSDAFSLNVIDCQHSYPGRAPLGQSPGRSGGQFMEGSQLRDIGEA